MPCAPGPAVWQRGTGTSPAPRFDAGWTSIPLLPFIRQPTLIVAGTDDPIIPLANAKLMSRLLPTPTVHIHDGGHVDLVVNAAEHARVIEAFRRSRTMLGRAAPGLSPEDEDHWEVRRCATSAKDALPNTFCGELNRLARTRAFRKGTACSHLTTAIIALPVRPASTVR
jgi:hypothetical protein